MELRTLRAFVEVVRQGGFTQAAKKVFATQSTVSKAIKHLEDEIGVPLLDRIGHRSKLTAAGEIVYQRALRMLAERNDLMAELDQLRGLKRGTLRLGLPPVGSSMLFAPLFATFITTAIQALKSAWWSTAANGWRSFCCPARLSWQLRFFQCQIPWNGTPSGGNH